MGESDRRRRFQESVDGVAASITKEYSDKGQMIEVGWLALRKVWLHPESPPAQVRDCRWAFFAGAQHLLASIMVTLDPESEPTEADMRRMSLIHEELRRFEVEMKAELARVSGHKGTA